MRSKHCRILIVATVCTGIVFVLDAASARTAFARAATDPCAMLTQAQISGIVGMTVGAGEPIGTSGCQWAAAPKPNTTVPRVTLQLWDAQAFTDFQTPLPGVTKTAASGIGEDAVYATVGSLTTLSVKKGSVAFVVRLYGVRGQASQMDMEKALALDVLPNL